MSAFGRYAQIYDALYADKDYAGEGAYLDALLQEAGAGRRILDLGCGTGRHLEQLARRGYEGTGVDGSEGMLALARSRLAAFPRLRLVQGDARTVRLGERFDAVLACFHVMNYLAEPGDFDRGLETARVHLGAQGILLFDSWHGPAVRAEPPQSRQKAVDFGGDRVVRHATPRHWPETQRVDVHYRIESRGPGGDAHYEEVHRLRYLFEPEVEMALARHGFQLRAKYAWLTHQPPTGRDWSACYVAARTDA